MMMMIIIIINMMTTTYIGTYENSRSRWLRDLSRGPAAARLQRLRFRISPEEWISVSCEYCVLSGRGLCVWLITRPEDSYQVSCVQKCGRETL
jgi:hypothetical protein